jgi:hypothetical protein
MSLAFPDFQLATVENVFHSLVAREYIGPEHLSSYYLSFRSWRSKPLPMKSTFLDLGIQRHATLILCLRRQGGTSQHHRHNPIRAAKTNHRYVQDQMATDHSVLPSRKRARSEHTQTLSSPMPRHQPRTISAPNPLFVREPRPPISKSNRPRERKTEDWRRKSMSPGSQANKALHRVSLDYPLFSTANGSAPFGKSAIAVASARGQAQVMVRSQVHLSDPISEHLPSILSTHNSKQPLKRTFLVLPTTPISPKSSKQNLRPS